MINIIQDLVPTSNSNRPGTLLIPTYITVHETANSNKGANAEMHAKYVKGEDAQSREVSWHITLDDTTIIQHLPFNEIGWHAGSEGNSQSIGIELCVNSDGDFSKTRINAIQVIRSLMTDLEIPIENVVTHQHWTGKKCPANLLNEWESFIGTLQREKDDNMETFLIRVKADELWVYNAPDWKARYKTVRRGDVFTFVEALTVSGSLMYRLKSGLFITGNTDYVEKL